MIHVDHVRIGTINAAVTPHLRKLDGHQTKLTLT